MKLIILILLCCISFGSAAEPNERIYQVKVVETVDDDPLAQGGIKFEIDDRPQVNTDNLEEDERMDMCRKGAKEVRRREAIIVKIAEKGKTGLRKSYALNRSETSKKKGKGFRVELVDAFTCPTQPTLYLQVHEKGEEQTITVIVPTNEARRATVQPNEIQYELIRVTDIAEATTREVRLYGDEEANVDPDDYPLEDCIEMCENALDTFSDRSIRWSKNVDVGDIKFYRLDLEGRKRNPRIEVVLAFECPTHPPVLISIPQKVGKKLVSWLIVEDKEVQLPKTPPPEKETPVAPRFARPKSPVPRSPRSENVVYEYELRVALNIIDITSESSREARLTNVIRAAIDMDKLSEEMRLRMCRKGIKAVESYEYRFVTFAPKEKTGASKFYAVHSEIGEQTVIIELVEAFQCPTNPALYIHVNDQRGNEGMVWIIIKQMRSEPGFDGAAFNVQVVQDITGYSKSPGVHTKAIDTDDLSEEERQKLCRKGVKLIPGNNAEYPEDLQTGLSRLYSIEAAKEHHIVRAYRCPTEPEIFLRVELDSDFGGYSVEVFVREKDLEKECDDSCYQIKYIDSITEPDDCEDSVFTIPQVKSVDTDKMEEEERMEMCEKAVNIEALRDTKIKFIKDGETGASTIYIIEVRGAARRAKPEAVQAFYCPTKPSVYLQVLETKGEKHLVYVLFNDEEPEEVKFAGDDDDPRLEFCKRALGLSTSSDSPVGNSKYALLGLELTGSGVDKIKGKNLLKAISCPTKPSLRLDVRPNVDDIDEDDGIPVAYPAYPAWDSRGLTSKERRLKDMNFRVKKVDKVIENFFRRKTEYIPEFPEEDRYLMCKDATRMVYGRRIRLLGNEYVGSTQNYKIQLNPRRTETVQAFKCPTSPPIFLEVIDKGYDSSTVWIIVERSDPVVQSGVYNGIQYAAKYVTEISEASSREIASIGRRKKIAAIDEEEFKEEERFEMCKNAAKVISGKPVQLHESLVSESKYYSIRKMNALINDRSGKQEVVKAFECPSVPVIYLQYEEDDDQPTVWVIIKRIPPGRQAIIGYKLKFVRSVDDVNDDDEVEAEYDARTLVAPQNLEYDDDDRVTMCHDAAAEIPNADRYLVWLDGLPGEEQLYSVQVEYDNYIAQEILSAFQCNTEPPFYLQTYIDEFSGTSMWVVLDERKFDFVDIE